MANLKPRRVLLPVVPREKPQRGDYLKLRKDEEAHTTIDRIGAYRVYEGLWRVFDTQGEEYLVQRWAEGDNDVRKAWEEV